MSVKVDIKQLLEAGVHFGHKTSRWHPKMAPYIHSKRQDSHIIDLAKTVEGLEKALPAITKAVESGRKVLFVGTKKQVKEAVREAAESVKQPYVVELAKRYSKLEVQRYAEEIEALNTKYGGIKDLMGRPGILFVTDAIADANAIREAKTLNIPVVAIVDTNVNPEGIDYVIPANDDAIKGVKLLLDYVIEAIKEAKTDK